MSNFAEAVKMASFAIHKEGYKFIVIFALATAGLALLNNNLGLIGIVATLWCIFFFRDPERVIPTEKNVIVSPADGVVTVVEYGVEAPKDLGYGSKKFNKISIFLNVFNVHVNRVPVAGKITKISYQSGEFLSANDPDASEKNERNSAVVKTADGAEIIFVQVAGLVARRIISDLKEGEEVKTGDRYGIIRFGSRADLYFPDGVEIKALLGQTMIGGETIIAKLSK